MGLQQMLRTFLRTLARPPATISLGVLTLGGFVMGIVFWGGFHTAMEATNTEEFCISCHEMRDNVYEELKQTVHWSNRTGVRATCPDCHVPHDWSYKVARKMQATKEFWGHLFGSIDTREKFEAKRLELAQHEWQRLSANGSLECRQCHDYASMQWEKMSEKAQFYMAKAADKNQSCIDCHKGIAHELPADAVVTNPLLAELEQRAASEDVKAGERYFTLGTVEVFADEALTAPAGSLETATTVEIVAVDDGKVRLTVPAWRKEKGFGRVLFQDFGRNIRAAVLTREAAQQADLVKLGGEPRMDDTTGLNWREVEAEVWARSGDFVSNIDELWLVAAENYAEACSVCHAQPEPNHFDSNGWPAQFLGMVGFTSMSPDTRRLVLKYLQTHSSDYSQAAH